jgi:hypothetical protein
MPFSYPSDQNSASAFRLNSASDTFSVQSGISNPFVTLFQTSKKEDYAEHPRISNRNKYTFFILPLLIFIGFYPVQTEAQRAGYWQQAVEYQMDIDMNVETNRFDGHQVLTYHNNSPDRLDRVFYHLFLTLFSPTA